MTDIDVVEGAGGRVVVVDDDVVVGARAVVDDALEPVVGAPAAPDGLELEHAPNVSDTATSAAAAERVSGRSPG